MFSHKKRLLFTIILTCLIPLAIPAHSPPIGLASPVLNRDIPRPGITIYSEDFSTTTYLDVGNTSAEGWGSGFVRNSRSYQLGVTDYIITPSPLRSVSVQGRKAYATMYNTTDASASLQIYDISDPSDISQMSNSTASTDLIAGEVTGDIFYLGSTDGRGGGTWLGAFNVSNPYSVPAPADTFGPINGSITDFAVQGRFLYVSIYQAVEDFLILDIQDPSNIFEVNSLNYPEILGLDINGQLAYLAAGINGLKILNISNPYAITSVGGVNTPGNATDCFVEGDLCYVADGSSGVQIIDVSNPASPSILGSYNTPGNAQKLALQEHTLYVADGSGGLQILDVSDPTNTEYLVHFTLDSYDVEVYNEGFVMVGYSSFMDSYVIAVVEIHGLGNSIVNPFLPVYNYTAFDALDVDVQGDMTFIAAGTDGLVILDTSDPFNPTLITNYQHNTSVNYLAIDVQGPYCYILDNSSVVGSRGLWAVDVSNPSSPVFRSRRDFTESYDLCVDGDVAYVAAGTQGLAVVNVTNSFDIDVDLDWVYDGSNYTAVCVQGRYVYAVASGVNNGLFIYEATDLTNLRLTSNLGIVSPLDVAVSGDFCVVANSTGGILFINVTDPWSTPVVLDTYTNWWIRGVDFFGTYILATLGYTGTFLFDASNPALMTLYRIYQPFDRYFERVKISGDYAYVACRDSLVIFRLFRSAANCYETTNIAQSLDVDPSGFDIGNTTITCNAIQPYNTTLSWFLSADGGSHWESVTPGVPHEFSFKGDDLRWRVQISSTFEDRTATVLSLSLSYNTLPTVPVLNIPVDPDKDGLFNVTWGTSTDDTGVVSYYLEMSHSVNFAYIVNSWVLTRTWQNITMTEYGTRYFRVRALDDNGEYSLWSKAEVINVVIIIPYPPPPSIPGFPIEAVAVGLGLAVGFGLLRRRKGKTS